MEIFRIKTDVLVPPKDDIFRVLKSINFEFKNRDIVCIASKCLSISQGRCVKIGEISKAELIFSEADVVLDKRTFLTQKDDVIVPFSGIDESNGNGYYILWPKDVGYLLNKISEFLHKKYGISELGIISVDSTILPLRRGTVGVAQDMIGFNPIRNYIGERDIFGRELKITTVDIADSIASVACYAMGEGAECCPIVVCRGFENVEFGRNFSSKSLTIPSEEDMFSGLLAEK